MCLPVSRLIHFIFISSRQMKVKKLVHSNLENVLLYNREKRIIKLKDGVVLQLSMS